MITNEDLMKIFLASLAASFVAPVALGLLDHWRWHPPRWWLRIKRFHSFMKGNWPW